MKIEDIKKPDEKKTVRLNLVTYPSISKWMKDNKISPNALFDKAVKELIEQTEQEKNK
jgi:hypothetical protein